MNKPTPIILAGGSGTRFAPFVSDKLLWNFMGKTFVSYVIETLITNGLNSIIVVANKNNKDYFESLNYEGVDIRIVVQDTDGGMSAALQKTRPLISKQPIIVLNADDIFETNLIKELLDVVSSENPETLLIGLERSEYLPVGYLNVKNDRVVGVIEKPDIDKRPSNLVKLVLDYYSNSDKIFHYLEKTLFVKGSDSHYEDSLNAYLSAEKAGFLAYKSYWNKLKYPHYVLDIMQIMQTHKMKGYISKSATVSQKATVEDGVFIDSGATIDDGAIVKSGSYIGRGVKVGNNALVRSSFIEEKSVIGFGSEIARSYVGPRCQVHHSFIGDSVLESDINMSWGTVTANLRLDGKEISLEHPNGSKILTNRNKLGAMIAKGAFLGINVSTMPGVCINANSKILPGTIVKK